MSDFPHLPASFFESPILLDPVFSPRPWGGDQLQAVLGKPLPEDKGPIGESWELSDHPDGRSVVGGHGPAAGRTFGDLVRAYPSEMIGRHAAPEKFPLLIKYIDAAGDLSVQVHPDDQWCRETGHPDRGKSECWYVMDCQPGTQIVYGFRDGVTEDQARAALRDGTFTQLLRFVPIAPGDFIAVPPRTVHAMMAGTLICEIQQSSNTTFRLYDWDRQPPRALHLDESFKVSDFDNARLPAIRHTGPLARRNDNAPDSMVPLIANDFFDVCLYEIYNECSVYNVDLCSPVGSVVNVVCGSGVFMSGDHDIPIRRGQTWFLPAAMGNPGLEAGPEGLRLLVSTSREL